MPRLCTKVSDTVLLESLDQLLVSHCRSLIFVDFSPYAFHILRCSVCCRLSGTWITFNWFSTIFEAFVPHFYLHYTHCVALESLPNHPKSFRKGTLKHNTNLDADSLLYSFSHFEYGGHRVHMLTQQCLPTPLTSTVKLSLFTHVHSSPHSLVVRLHHVQIVLIMLIMAGLFLDRPHT